MESALYQEPKGRFIQVITAAVLGSPISHSLSPLLHAKAYAELGIEGTYESREVKSGELKSFLNSNGSVFNNLSLTMPLKEEALAIADSVTKIAQQIQSGNTLRKVDGKWELTSTDVEGFSFALQSHGKKADGNLLVIGAGATARAVVASCDGVSSNISVLNRSPEREEAIRLAGPKTEIKFIPWDSPIDFQDFDLVVNTTPGDTASIFCHQITSARSTFFEVLYNPWPTQLLSHWRNSGGYGIDGLDLLIHQAISQVELFAGISIDRSGMAKLLRVEGERALS